MADKPVPAFVPGFFMGFLLWKGRTTKTANYTLVTNDNGTVFDNSGAVGSVTFTLPTLAANYRFGFRCLVAQTITVTAPVGGTLIAFNNAAGTNIALSTAGQQIGGFIIVESLPDASAWFAYGQGPNTLTIS